MNVYQLVTDKICDQLAKGVIPWQQPWITAEKGGALNYVTRKYYSPLNQLFLRPGEYLTFNQIKERNGNIRKGAKADIVVFFKKYEKKEQVQDSDSEDSTRTAFVLRYYHVFNIADTEGIESRQEQPQLNNDLQPIDKAEDIINGYVTRPDAPKFHNSEFSNSAFYRPSTDEVFVPMMAQYKDIEEYYSTTFHELTHSTGAPQRLDRKGEQKTLARFGSKEYSREELVAEIGAAMLCNTAGLNGEKAFKNSVAYIKGWLEHLKSDNHAIVWAATRAEKAARYILNEPITE